MSDIDRCLQCYVNWYALLIFFLLQVNRMLTCVCLQYTTKRIIWHTFYENYYHTAVQTMTSQFNDRLIIGYGKTMTVFKKIQVS